MSYLDNDKQVVKETNDKIIVCVMCCSLLVVGVGVKTIEVRIGPTIG